MTQIHPDAELAPRDVVARAVTEQSLEGGAFLDATGIDHLSERFPTGLRRGYSPQVSMVRLNPSR